MLGKILIVDQIATNRIALRVKLSAAQYEADQASTQQEAIEAVLKNDPDLVITSEHLKDGTAGSLIEALSAAKGETRPPVIVLTRSSDDAHRAALLNSGADEVMPLNVNEVQLLASVRSLVRAATADAEWHMRGDTARALGFAETAKHFEAAHSIALIGADPNPMHPLAQKIRRVLPNAQLSVWYGMQALRHAAASEDAFLLVLGDDAGLDMMRLMSSLRCRRESRNAAMMVIQSGENADLAAYALDLGANELIQADASDAEFQIRLTRMLKRKRQSDQLRDTLESGLQAAVNDPLTGLHNRRYAIPHLERLLERAMRASRPLAVMVADLDHFKRVNDRFGHAAGDAVLIEAAHRLRDNLRAVDLVARIGGEEFLIVLPHVTLPNAQSAANRLCRVIHDTPITLPGGTLSIPMSASIGLSVFDPDCVQLPEDVPRCAETLIAEADRALYVAKEKGRNRVRLARPAA